MLTVAEIGQFIESDITSEKKLMAKKSEKYYEAEHDILQYRCFYYNADGNLVEDTTRTNMKISHPFFTELVDQEVQYMLSGDEPIIQSDAEGLQDYLDEYFDDDFVCELHECLTGAITKGFDYMYLYMNNQGRLSFQHADSMGVVEVRAKDTDDGCEYIIYWYIDRIDKGHKVIKRIQVWDKEETHFFVQVEGGKIVPDETEKRNPRPHIIRIDENGDKYGSSLGFIPFFRLDNCKKQFSGLKPIKSIIDDYDMMSCGLSNNLADFDHPLHVVKGFQGDDLTELEQNLKTKKMIGVDDTGGVEVHTVDIPYQARLAKMQEDEKNIYRFGMGFNSAQLGDGNITNIVIKSRYALLDLKCDKLEIRLKQFLKQIIRVVIDQINDEHETDYQNSDVYFNFDREVMTNASDNAQIELTDAQTEQTKINTILNIATVVGSETVIKAICDILDLDFDDIQDALDEDELQHAEDKLNQVVPDDEGGGVIEQKTITNPKDIPE